MLLNKQTLTVGTYQTEAPNRQLNKHVQETSIKQMKIIVSRLHSGFRAFFLLLFMAGTFSRGLNVGDIDDEVVVRLVRNWTTRWQILTATGQRGGGS